MLKKLLAFLTEDKKLLKQGSILFSTTLFASLINYFYHFSMGRLLGPAGYGVVGALFAILYFLIAVLNTIQTVTAKFVSALKAEKKFGEIGYLLKKSHEKILILGMVFFVIFMAGAKPLSTFLHAPAANIIIFNFVFLVVFVVSNLRGILQGLQKFIALGANVIFEAIIKIASGIALVLLGFGVNGALAAIVFSFAGAWLLASLVLKKYKNNIEQYKIDGKAIYAYSIPVVLAMSAITAIYTVDVILVKHFFSPASAGHYAAAALLAKIIFFASVSISQVMFPKISELKAKNLDYEPTFRKSLLIVAGLTGAAATVYALAPKLVVGMLFGPEYFDIIPIMGLFGLTMALFSIAYLFVNYFLSSGKTKFLPMLLLFPAAEIISILTFHSSLWVIVKIMAFVAIGLLASLTVAYVFGGSEEKNGQNTVC
ncbi:MAG: oligosaccharide flippase family protein [DPANN group archaeon]|nr:oligosaccharide flippase family protein [DPANN group archaeon]